MNSIVKKFGKSALKFSSINFKNMFININMRSIHYNNNECFDLGYNSLNSFGAKKVDTQSGNAGGNKVKNVSTSVSNSKMKGKKVQEEEVEEEEQPKVKKTIKKVGKASPVVEVNSKTKQSVSAGKKKAPVVEEEEEELPKTKRRVVSTTPTPKASVKVDAKKKSMSKKSQSESVEEEDEIEETIQNKFKKPKKAVHTMQTEPVNLKTQKKVVPEKIVKSIPTAKSVKTVKSVQTAKSAPVQSEGNLSAEVPTTKSAQPKKRNTSNLFKKKVDPNEFPEVDLNKLGRVGLGHELDTKKYTLNPNGIYDDYIMTKSTELTKKFIALEREHMCNNYAPLPVICDKGKGVFLQDVDGYIYIDFLSAYSAVNHGHGNQNIINAAIEQMNKLHMTSRAFYNTVLGKAGEMICKLFQYEKVLFMNSGVEAGESAVKIARRWGYVEKGIPDNHAKIVFAKGNFWGRSLYACATSDDPSRYRLFGPFEKESHYMVEFGNIEELTNVLENDKTIAAVFLEPIQGEGGVIIPPQGYLTQVQELCKKHNVLLILDEIQTGIGRTGFLLCSNMENVQPDIVLLAKSLSGGLYPVSAVLTSRKIMDVIKPGEHGSTFGGNPLAANIVLASLQELFNQPMIKNSYFRGMELGLILREELENNRFVKEVRGRGLMYAIELWPECGFDAYDFSLWLMERGVLCKPTKQFTLRLSPPLVITTTQIEKSAEIISYVLNRAQSLNPDFVAPDQAKFNIPSSGTEFESDFINNRRTNKLNQLQHDRNVNIQDAINPNASSKSEDNIQDPFSQIQTNENKEENNVYTQVGKDILSNVPNPFQMSNVNILGLNLDHLTETSDIKEGENEIVIDSEIELKH